VREPRKYHDDGGLGLFLRVDAHALLADTLARIPEYMIANVDELMPWKWRR
jgi:hypothetical protein